MGFHRMLEDWWGGRGFPFAVALLHWGTQMTIMRCDLPPHWLPHSVSRNSWRLWGTEWQGILSCPGFFPSQIDHVKILCSVTKISRMVVVSLTSMRIKGKHPESVEGWGSEARQVGFLSWLCHRLAMRPWAGCIPFLGLGSWINGCNSLTHQRWEKLNELLCETDQTVGVKTSLLPPEWNFLESQTRVGNLSWLGQLSCLELHLQVGPPFIWFGFWCLSSELQCPSLGGNKQSNLGEPRRTTLVLASLS